MNPNYKRTKVNKNNTIDLSKNAQANNNANNEQNEETKESEKNSE